MDIPACLWAVFVFGGCLFPFVFLSCLHVFFFAPSGLRYTICCVLKTMNGAYRQLMYVKISLP